MWSLSCGSVAADCLQERGYIFSANTVWSAAHELKHLR
ncbi:hypothetical protein JCM19237_6158 [Photobacterium aphoticum]|uniref:Uncharacterized protein n=1 Tax=Photobacterium aphoticum TaxID=754436 RepID=A0A090QJD7_9GAMM|nr:hypothetical protein JCM19237_6158 [Photobacterium aphoticum]